MGIQVECPMGHIFKVKDKYAGKKGLCPKCEGQVVVQVPDLLSTTSETLISHQPPASLESTDSSSIFDDPPSAHGSSSGSLLSGSFIQHKIACPNCKKKAPMWYARCPECGEYLEH